MKEWHVLCIVPCTLAPLPSISLPLCAFLIKLPGMLETFQECEGKSRVGPIAMWNEVLSPCGDVYKARERAVSVLLPFPEHSMGAAADISLLLPSAATALAFNAPTALKLTFPSSSPAPPLPFPSMPSGIEREGQYGNAGLMRSVGASCGRRQ